MTSYLNLLLLSDTAISIEQIDQKTDRFSSFTTGKNCRVRINDFKTALESLKSSSFQELKSKIIFALDKLNYYSIHNYSTDLSIKEMDQISLSLLNQSEIHDMNPCKIVGDGNCLFREVSKALYNTESYHQELRFRCIVELCLNFEKYLDLENYTNNTYIELIATVNPSSSNTSGTNDIFQAEILRISSTQSYASSLNLFGLANSLTINIHQIYPKRDFRDTNFKSLLTEQISPFMKLGVKDIFIMWTHYSDMTLRSNWAPNHFTCCFKSIAKSSSPIKRDNVSLDSVKDLEDEVILDNKIKKNYKRILITSDTEDEEKFDWTESKLDNSIENHISQVNENLEDNDLSISAFDERLIENKL